MPVRYAVLSDVHANQPALQAVLADLEAQGVERVLCLGDVVGYGADPGPVLDAIATRAEATVAGNHDHAAAGMMDLDWFNPYARRAAEWTADRLGPAQSRYLAGLALRLTWGEATLVHASPEEPGRWRYVVSAADGVAALPHFATRLCYIGHSHLPAVWMSGPDGRVRYRPGGGRVPVEGDARYLVNVGSVGQPRDGDPLAAYAVRDVEAGWLEIRRVPYDVREARARIHRAGLPRFLGDRLLHGR